MDESIARILQRDKEAKEALEKRVLKLAELNKEFEIAKQNIDDANHAAYEFESQRLNSEMNERREALAQSLRSEYEALQETLIKRFDEKSDEWVERLVKESMNNV